MRLQIALLSLLTSLPGAAQAVSLAGPGLHPLLKVHEDRTFVPTTPIAESFHFDDDLLVAQDGSFVYEEVLRQFFIDAFRPAQATLAHGTAPADLLAGLNRELAAARIGTLESNLVCRLDLQPDEGYVLSWYGRTNRAIRVTVTPQAGVPDCPAAVGLALQAARVFKEGALAAPATRTSTSP